MKKFEIGKTYTSRCFNDHKVIYLSANSVFIITPPSVLIVYRETK